LMVRFELVVHFGPSSDKPIYVYFMWFYLVIYYLLVGVLLAIGVMLCPLLDGAFDLINPFQCRLLDFRCQAFCVVCPVGFPTLQLFYAHRVEAPLEIL